MIYLSGSLRKDILGFRKDIGLMATFGHNERKHLERVLWALDNGCYTNPDLDETAYLSTLKKMSKNLETCLFATAPDVVGDAKATWERSEPFLPKIRALGYAAAFVAQDGIESNHIEWNAFDAIFIGGSTEFKLSDAAFWLTREAAKRGKWTHWGRVNSMRRILQARFAGANSVDGTHIVFKPDIRVKEVELWLDTINNQPILNF